MTDEHFINPVSPGGERQVVVVLGMHRSGTSAVAGCLQRMGVDFGPRMMPATADNPRGYYEHIDLVNLHDRLLLALGRSWDDTFPFPADWWLNEPATGRYREEAVRILRRDFPGDAAWGLKDPRLCRLLPWWMPLWQATNSVPYFVIVRRSPREVAASLNKREGFSAAKSYLLWLQHLLEAERNTRGQRRVFVDFTSFLADWRGALEPIAHVLRQMLPSPGRGTEMTADEFVDPGLARQAKAVTVPEEIPSWVDKADAALLRATTGWKDEILLEFDHLTEQMKAAEHLFIPRQNDAAQDLQQQLGAVRKQAAWYESEWQKARSRGDNIKEKLASKKEELARLKQFNQK